VTENFSAAFAVLINEGRLNFFESFRRLVSLCKALCLPFLSIIMMAALKKAITRQRTREAIKGIRLEMKRILENFEFVSEQKG
jgi:hypothetical protein